MVPEWTEGSDERNGAFGLPELALEEMQPGLRTNLEDREREEGEGQERLTPLSSKQIPRESLSERIRRAPETGSQNPPPKGV